MSAPLTPRRTMRARPKRPTKRPRPAEVRPKMRQYLQVRAMNMGLTVTRPSRHAATAGPTPHPATSSRSSTAPTANAPSLSAPSSSTRPCWKSLRGAPRIAICRASIAICRPPHARRWPTTHSWPAGGGKANRLKRTAFDEPCSLERQQIDLTLLWHGETLLQNPEGFLDVTDGLFVTARHLLLLPHDLAPRRLRHGPVLASFPLRRPGPHPHELGVGQGSHEALLTNRAPPAQLPGSREVATQAGDERLNALTKTGGPPVAMVGRRQRSSSDGEGTDILAAPCELVLSSAKRQKSGSSLGSSTAATSSLQRTLSSPSRRPPAAWALIVEVHLDCRGASAAVALPRLPPRPECCHLPESSDHTSIFLERANPPPSRRTIEECAGYRSFRLY